MAFRLVDPKPQFTLAAGPLAALGRILFYTTGTTTPKSVFGEPALSTDLGSEIPLNAAGRTTSDIWLAEDEEYRIDVQDSNNVSIPGYPLDHIRNTIGSGLAPPDPSGGVDGDSLLTDGTEWYFQTLRELPDPTGHANTYLTCDGSAWNPTTIPEAATYDATNLPGGITSAPTTVVIGTVRFQWGSDTAPSNGSGLTTTKAVTFGTAFSGTPTHIDITPVLSSGVSSNSPPGFPTKHYSSPSTTGFTAGFAVGEENTGGTDTISSTIPFTYFAVGPA